MGDMPKSRFYAYDLTFLFSDQTPRYEQPWCAWIFLAFVVKNNLIVSQSMGGVAFLKSNANSKLSVRHDFAISLARFIYQNHTHEKLEHGTHISFSNRFLEKKINRL